MPRNIDMSKVVERGYKMKLVVKSDTYGVGFAITITIIADFLLIFFGIKDNTLLGSGITALVITLFIAICFIISINEKLIIDGNKLCYKSIRKKFYDISDVSGLLVVKAQVAVGKTLSGWDLKNKYVIVYLKDKNFEYKSHYGSIDLWKYHRKHILFTTVYDEQVIEYFKLKGISVTGEI